MPRLIALILLLSTSTALAQIGQFPGVAPSVPSPFAASPQLGGAPAPPMALAPSTQLGGAPAPPMALSVPAVPPNLDSGPSLMTRRNGRPVVVPGGPSDFSSKVERCVQAGTEAGVRPNAIGAFTRQCAN